MKQKVSHLRLKEVLTKRRDALRRVLRHDLAGLRTGVGLDIGDSVDVAVDDEFNLVSSQLAQTESRELEQIEDALARMQRGRYGVCESCGTSIPSARLQALPYARHCVQCQRQSESHETGSTSRMDWSTLRDEVEEDPYNPFAEHVIDVH
jgi:DnaK suppressor protein